MLTVWVTRDETPDGPLATALRSVGLGAIVEPVITRRVVDQPSQLISHLSENDWLVLTSPFATDALSGPCATRPKVAVIGDATRRCALANGMRVECVAPRPDRESLFAELAKKVDRATVCYPRSSRATPPPAWGQVTIQSPILYHTRSRPFDRGVIDRSDVAAFASESAVSAAGYVDLPAAAIGPKTTRALKSLGMSVVAQAPAPDFDALAAAIADYARSSRHHRA